MPPLREILDALRQVVLPASAVAALVFYLVSRLAPRRGVALGAALALAASFLVANHFRGAVGYRLEEDRPLELSELASTLCQAAQRQDPMPVAADDSPPLPQTLYWLPWLSALGLLAGVLTRPRWTPRLLAWIVYLGVALLAARLLVPQELVTQAPWIDPAFVALGLASGIVLETLTRRFPGGALPGTISLVYFLSAVVLIHAHSARLADLATVTSAALAGLALVAWVRRLPIDGAVGGVALLLPGLLLVGQQNTFSEVPLASFLLPALAPLALTPLLLPQVVRWSAGRRVLLGLALVGIPAMLAVILAARAESLLFSQ